MRQVPFLVAAAAVVAVAAAWAPRVHSESQAEKKGALFASAEKAEYKELMPGASKAVIWGDPEKGPYGAFTRFKAGFDAGMHTHSSDVRVVGVRGAYVYKAEGTEIRVAPGCFLFIPAGTKHSSGGDEKEGALFYEEGTGKFDLNPAK
ncbi:MAG: DUF4437 domain-containing protein [Planctomycetota bacterium]